MAVEELPILLSVNADGDTLNLRIDEGGWSGQLNATLPVQCLRCASVLGIQTILEALDGAVGLECEVEEGRDASGQVEVHLYINFHVDAVVVVCGSTSSGRSGYEPGDVERKMRWLFQRYAQATAQYEETSTKYEKYRGGLEAAIEGLLSRAKKKLEHYEPKGKGQSFKGEVAAYERALTLVRTSRV